MTITNRLAFEGCDGSALRVEPATGRVLGEWRPIRTGDGRSPLDALDFPTPAELCRCCGQELLPSGSRWSVWFCAECKERVVALNERARTCVVPIGRHSLMNGVFMTGRPPKSVEIEGFAVRLADLFDRTHQLDDWAPEAVRRNCVATGLDGRAEVPLAEYLDVVRRARLPRSDAFRAMLNWWSAQPARS